MNKSFLIASKFRVIKEKETFATRKSWLVMMLIILLIFVLFIDSINLDVCCSSKGKHLTDTRNGTNFLNRYKKLPPGTQRDWKHVVDARGGGSGSTKSVKITSKKNRSRNKDHRSTIEDGDDNIDCLRRVGSPDQSDYSDDYEFASDDEIESLEGKRRIRTSRCPSRPSKRIPRDEDNNNNDNPRISPFIDTNYWRREEICCGIIFRAGNSIVIHPKLMRPCSCRQDKNTSSSVNGSGTDQSSLASPTSSSPPSSVLVLEKKPSIGGSSSDNQSVSSSPSMLEEVDNESNASNSYASTFICV